MGAVEPVSTLQGNWADEAMASQREYFMSGATRSYEFRVAQLKKLKQVLADHQGEIIEALKKDLGRPATEGYIELSTAFEDLKHTIKHLKSWMKPQRVGTTMWAQPGRSRIESTPLGVNFIMGPYNYPFLLCVQPLIGAIAGGNTVIMKPSSLNPATSQLLADLAQKYFDPRLWAVFQGSTEITNALLEQPFDHIFFTGSPRVGRIVMAAAAKHLTKVTLELGGKSPTIIHSDANLKLAAKRTLAGKMLNVGQTCIAPDHIFVHSSVKEQFEKHLLDAMKEFYGEADENNPDLGRMINGRHFERVRDLIDQTKVIFGGKSVAEQKFIQPTLLSNVTMDDPIMQEEIFGPVLPILTYDNLQELYANIRKLPSHPLALYLFTNSSQVEEDVLANVQFGGGCINNTVMHVANANLPFGGVGESGMGAYHGKSSFDTFTHKRAILKSATFLDIKLRYAPYGDRANMLSKMIK